MRKLNKITYFVFALISLILASCNTEEPDIFDASPAERINQAISDYQSVLTSAENGWEMDYFANPLSGGYTLLVKFNKSGNAIFASRHEYTVNKAYETDSCLFDIISDNGPVLTFNTYSNILHIFASPDFIDDPYYYGYGLEGDYEFVITKATTDSVWLKGKKYGAEIILHKLESAVNWQYYMNNRYDFNSMIFSAKAPDLSLKIDRVTYKFAYGYSHVFNVKRGSDTSLDIPFITTNNGIKLYKDIELEGYTFREFKINNAKNALVSVENPQLKLVGADDLSNYFISQTNSKWVFNQDNTSSNYTQLLKDIEQSAIALYAADSVAVTIEYSTSRQSFVLAITTFKGDTKTEGLINLSFDAYGYDEIKISYKDNQGNVKGNSQGLQYYNDIPELANFLELLSTTYDLDTASKLNPLYIQFYQKGDAQTYFEIK